MRWEESDLFCHDLPTSPPPGMGTVLVIGATGYVGGRLVPELLARGYNVRVAVRDTAQQVTWETGGASRTVWPEYMVRWPKAEIVAANALDRESLNAALEGVHTAYYLIHSMVVRPPGERDRDTQAAVNFQEAAAANHVHRIIYLGSLADNPESKSSNLRNRARVGEALAQGVTPVTTLRSAMIIGSGSFSYEIVEYLVKNTPWLLMPKWSHNSFQPIAIRDVIKYLVGVLETRETSGQVFHIGGPDVLTYEKMLRIQHDLLGQKKLFVYLPVLNPFASAYFVSLFSPVPRPITLCLVEVYKHNLICEKTDIQKYLSFETLPYVESIKRAISLALQDKVRTRWSDAFLPHQRGALKLHELQQQPDYVAAYSLVTTKSDTSLFQSICRIGGKEGWFYSNWLWRIRGACDRLLNGVGTARGRRTSMHLRLNDVIDFWRVEDVQVDERLLLRAEMKLPGWAWLEFRIEDKGMVNLLIVCAHFQSSGFWGKMYWYSMLPFHYFIFTDMINQIEKRS
jgi:uncharacterized protein YbjT (DUF2867 family)